MRYMLHLFSIAFAILFSPIAFVFRLAAEAYQPTASEIIEADSIAPALPRSSRSSAVGTCPFIERAKAHVDFTAGHFDPGRMAA